jgi:uncharacterized protein
VHVSQLADRFVKDPREVVKPGDVVRVRVVEVDVGRKRIALSLKAGEGDAPLTERRIAYGDPSKPIPGLRSESVSLSEGGGAIADALQRSAYAKKISIQNK